MGVFAWIVLGILGALLGGFVAKELFGVQTLDTFLQSEYLGHRDRRCRGPLPARS
jgi:uncharacterized membrane protein YeaQ/YmgE (transglycosylase-associated protein family)